MLCSKRLGGTGRGERRGGWEGNSRWLYEARETGEKRERGREEEERERGGEREEGEREIGI